MFYVFYNLKDDNGRSRVCFDGIPKFRSAVTGTYISWRDTSALERAVGTDGIHLLVKNKFLIEEGVWEMAPDNRTWQELCEHGEVVMAAKKFKDVHGSTLFDAKKAVDNYREHLKSKYGRKG